VCVCVCMCVCVRACVVNCDKCACVGSSNSDISVCCLSSISLSISFAGPILHTYKWVNCTRST